MTWVRRWFVLVLTLFLLTSEKSAHAFCGFYVDTGGARLFNEASRVVLMRVGMRTVLSLQNDYRGPLENFALVIPVPVVLEKKNVRTLPTPIFNRIDRLTSPRLVEYWEQDPCPYQRDDEQADNKEGGTGTRAKGEEGALGAARPLVKIEAEFSVDEYDIVILSALDSGALETWLLDNKYVVPSGAEPYLRPYVQEGSKFFVARVDASRVRSSWGRAQLSPLRFFYDSTTFTLPTRLGLINSGGVQDLVIYLLGETRFETANYENVFIPTNLTVKDETRKEFNAFYASLFDQTIKKHPHSVVTEYVWTPSKCDPCPGDEGPLADEDLLNFGGDVAGRPRDPLILTRLHARYGKDAAGDDLVFKAAPGVVGGREDRSYDPNTRTSTLNRDPVVGGSENAFQGRYVIRHSWTGPVKCMSPQWGVWGGPTNGAAASRPKTRKVPPPSPFARRDLDANQFILDQEVERRVVQGGAGGSERSPIGAFVRRLIQRFEGFTLYENRERAHLWLLILTPIVAGLLARRYRVGVLSSLGLIVVTMLVANVAARLIGGVHFGRMITDRLLQRTLVDYTLTTFGSIVGVVGVVLQRRAATTATPRSIGLLYIWAVAPILFAMLECSNQASTYDIILREDTIEFSQRGRIAAEMASEILEPMTFSIVRSSVLLTLAAFFVVRVIRLDRAERTWSAPLVATGAAIVGHLAVLGALRWINSSDIGAILVFLIAALTIEHVDVRRAGGPTTFIALALAVLLVDLAAKNRNLTLELGALSGESIDPSQKAFLVREMGLLDTKRTLIAAIDVALVGGLALHRIRRRRSASQPKVPMSGWGLLSTATMMVMLVGALTTFGWTRSIERITVLDALTRHLGWQKGDPPVTTVSKSASVDGAADFVSGPALIVDVVDNQTYATPGPGKTPQPLAPQVYASMMQAATETDEPPILVLQQRATTKTPAVFENAIRALQPLLAARQSSFRLFPDPGAWTKETIRRLGDYSALVTLADFEPASIDIVERIAVDRTPTTATQSSDGFWYGFFLDGDGLWIRRVSREPQGFRPVVEDERRHFKEKLALDGSNGGGQELSRRIDVPGNQVNALVIIDPKTPIDAAVKAIQVVDRLPVPHTSRFWNSMPRRTKVFTTMIVSPSADAFRGLWP